ncbi:MAG: glucokinase [Burkholderiaceae bacterium]|nr:glucokinase [Burkholderiaceae bacterium]
MNLFDRPRLLADIGATFARFTLEAGAGLFTHTASLRCADHADLHAAITAYLSGLPAELTRGVTHAVIAIANPVEGDRVRMTNYHWEFSIERLRQRLRLDTLVVVNDFTALAMALPWLEASQRRQVGGGTAREASVIGLIGSGSGLGVSGLIPAGEGWIALGTEGGHSSFAPRDEREILILRHAMAQHPHVSFERLLSGPGLELIHAALAADRRPPANADKAPGAPEITRRALDGSDALCREALDAFCGILGTAASNLAVTLGAFGGIYIGGSIVPRLGEYFDRSPFRARFEDKGRFSGYLQEIPTFVVTAEHATFVGASAILAQQLRSGAGEASFILAQIQRAREALSRAEAQVADHVLAHPRTVLNDPIAEIARAAGVSQPTVIRFCRSLGYEGLSDFKLRLASGLTGTVPITHTQVTVGDSVLELGAKVLGNTASAILQLRDHLQRDLLDRAIDLLIAADRVEFHAVGHYGMVADDAQFKFLRFGVPASSVTDPRRQLLTADLLRPCDVAVIVSSSGRVDDLLAVADRAHARGAAVVAITASQSPLAKKADLALIVDNVEDIATHVPMVSRILHLLVIDVLAVGVAMRRGAVIVPPLPDDAAAELDETQPPTTMPGARTAGGRVSASGPLAGLISHSRQDPGIVPASEASTASPRGPRGRARSLARR